MRSFAKKSLSIFLSVLMVLSLFGGLGLTASAVDDATYAEWENTFNGYKSVYNTAIAPVNLESSTDSLYNTLNSYDNWYTELLSFINDVYTADPDAADRLFNGLDAVMTSKMDSIYTALFGRLSGQLDVGYNYFVGFLQTDGFSLNQNDDTVVSNFNALRLVFNNLNGRQFAFLVNSQNFTVPAETMRKYTGIADALAAYESPATLMAYEIPDGVTKICADAFAPCVALESVLIPKSVTSVGGGAFTACTALATVNFTGGPADWEAVTIGNNAFPNALTAPTCYYYGPAGAENAIGDIGENDGTSAYKARVAVASVAYGRLTAAEQQQVTNANLLTTAQNSLSGYEFGACGDNVACAWNKATGEVVIGGWGPTWGYDNAYTFSPFHDTTDVKTVVITNGVTSVGAYMFSVCSYLESVTFPDDGALTTIGDSAFYACSQLQSLALPQGLTKVGEWAFAECSLKNITIPKSVMTIEDRAFAAILNLETINYTGSEDDWNRTSISDNAFFYSSLSAPTCYYYGVEGAMNAIDDIGAVVYTAACKARIQAARAAYDRLSDYETTLVTNYAALTKAEEDYAKLEARTDTGKALQLGDRCAVPNVKGAQQSNIWFGNYMQSSADSKEPVKWRVLQNAGGKLFLLADQNLDVVQYNNTHGSVTWETCTLRKWLNGYDGHPYDDTFIGSAFSDKETAAVAETAVVNDKNPTYNTPGGNNTTDKVFLLSIAEAKTTAYGFTDNYNDTATRVAKNTEYVHSGGHTGVCMNDEAGWWWLRTPGGTASWSSIVDRVGYVSDDGTKVDYSYVAVRPVFNLNLNAVLFTSAAENGKVGDGALTQIADYSGSDWKLTLPDESRAFAVTETAATAAPGGTVTLTYTGATVGTNEYISAILTDETGAAVYYGRLAQPDDADGVLTVAVPADLASGSYTLKVFSEQYNGDKKTDFAGAFCDVALSVLSELDAAKAAAKAELENYFAAIDPADYRDAQKTELEGAINGGKADIDAATDADAVATALAGAKEALDAIKTDAELTAEETLAAAKTAAKEELAAYKNADDYRADEQNALAEAIAAGEAAIDAAADVAAVNAALTAAEAAIDAIKTDAELTAEETLAAAKTAAKEALAAYKNADDYRADEQAALAEAIAAGEAAIDAAADVAAVNAALTAAEAVIDEIKTDEELTAEELAADTAAADEVETLISAIGEVAYSDESKAKIDKARSRYDALTPAQQALVENADVLPAAEARYDELKVAAHAAAEADGREVGFAYLAGRLLSAFRHFFRDLIGGFAGLAKRVFG